MAPCSRLRGIERQHGLAANLLLAESALLVRMRRLPPALRDSVLEHAEMSLGRVSGPVVRTPK